MIVNFNSCRLRTQSLVIGKLCKQIKLFKATAASTVTVHANKMSTHTDSGVESKPKPSYDDLEQKVVKLQAHVKQLQNLLKNQAAETKEKRQGKKTKKRPIDFTRYNTRHVALKIAYLGWDYGGFAAQEETDNTIEAALFEALQTTRLIESKENAKYSKCGRTDKGVSAFSQVISLNLRTSLLEGIGVIPRENGTAAERLGQKDREFPYIKMLNSVLPQEIRVLAWCPVDPEFSARFSCKRRTYKYFFPEGNLDIKAMKLAASKLEGEHDFRNFCKMDVGNGVINYTRFMFQISIESLNGGCAGELAGSAMYELTVVGTAFLWHQIRCVVAVLLLVGQGKENPEIVDTLLDIEKTPRRPQYTMASEIPLVLYDSEYEGLEWNYEGGELGTTIRNLQRTWTHNCIKSTQLGSLLQMVSSTPDAEAVGVVMDQVDCLQTGSKPRIYRPLLERPSCPSFEERIENVAKRRKISTNELMDMYRKRQHRDSDDSSSPEEETSS